MPYEPEKAPRRPVPVGGIVDGILGSLGLAKKYYGWLVVSRWSQIVGEHYARHSEAFRFEDGTLYVAVADDSWRQQLALDNTKIMEIIRANPHGRVVERIRLVRGKKGMHTNGS